MRGFLRATLLLSFLCFVSVGISVKQEAKTIEKTITGTTTSHLDITRKIVETERHFLQQNTNLNYVSKRRVPRGPDPIHNRKAVDYMETRIRV